MSHWDHEISILGPLNLPFNSCSPYHNTHFNPLFSVWCHVKAHNEAPELHFQDLINLKPFGPSRPSHRSTVVPEASLAPSSHDHPWKNPHGL